MHAFRQFYARRVLRIFPLLYLVLGLAAVLNIPPVRQTFAWHAAFLTNFYIFLHGFNHLTSHFWSLAVEEQFYLVWPWIILLVSRRRFAVTLRPEEDSRDEEATEHEEQAHAEPAQVDKPRKCIKLRRGRAKVANQDRQNGKGAQSVELHHVRQRSRRYPNRPERFLTLG